MANGDGWIASTDSKLIASIKKHEGNKDVIYRNLKSGKVKAAESCNADTCIDNGTSAYIDTEERNTVGIGHL